MRSNRRQGFTLIEILVVIAIIAMLMAMSVVAVRYARDRAEVAKAQHGIDVLYNAISQLMIDTDEWPGHQTPEIVNAGAGNEVWDLSSSESGLTQTDGLYSNWHGPYILEVQQDPWGNNYFFDTDYSINADYEPCDGGTGCFDAVVVGSFGPNGTGQNVYDSDDVIKVLQKE